MPRAAKKAKDIDPHAVYTAWQGGAAEIDGVDYTVAEGERRLGSDPMVQTHSWLFVADGTVEMPNAFTQVVERANAERAAAERERDAIVVHKPEPLEREDVRVLNRAITVAVGSGKQQELIQYERGTVFNARSELCTALPAAFDDPEPGVQFTRRGRR